MSPGYTPDSIAMIVRCLRVQVEGPGPICPVCVHQAGLVVWENGANRITNAGRVVLAMAEELDNERLLSEFHEAESELNALCQPPYQEVIDEELPARRSRYNAAAKSLEPIREWWRNRIIDREAARRAKEPKK